MTEQETTATAKDMDQVMPGPCCGRFVPGPDEIDEILAELGIERTAEHPEFDTEPEEDPVESLELEGTEVDGQTLILGAMQGLGRKLKLPNGTPRQFPPFPAVPARLTISTSRPRGWSRTGRSVTRATRLTSRSR